MTNNSINMKKASFFYLVGTLFNKGIAFLTVPIFTRILTVEDYGIVTTYNSWVGMVSMFISLALYMSVRNSFVDYENRTNDFLSTILLFTMSYGLCITGLILAIIYILPISVNLVIVALCMLHALGSALTESISQYLMMRYRFKARTAILTLPNLISTIVAIVLIEFVLFSNLYWGRIVPTALISFSFGVLLTIYFLPKGNISFNKEFLQYGLKISLPLVLHGIALNVLSQSDRTMITIIRDAEETGIYGLIYNFSMIATVITTAFEGIWVPFFVRKMKAKKYKDINSYSVKYIELMSIAMIGVILVGPDIVKLLATEPYWEGINVVPPIVLSNYLIFLYTLYVNVEHYYKKTLFISINTIIAAVTNILLNYFFIKEWGYVGAAYTTLISYGVSLILHYIYARTLNKEVILLKQIIIPTVVIITEVALFYIFIENWIIRWSLAIIGVLLLFVKEKDFLMELLRSKANG